MKDYERQSDSAQKDVNEAPVDELAAGRVEARSKNWVDGWVESWIEGRAQGRVEGAAQAVLIVLRARGIPAPDHLREQILAQKKLEVLRRWLDKAVFATSAAAVLDEPN